MIDKTLQIIAIREEAKRHVGPCSDFEITFCAWQGRILKQSVMSLDLLSEYELLLLFDWVKKG